MREAVERVADRRVASWLRLRRDQILRMEDRARPRCGGDSTRSHGSEWAEPIDNSLVTAPSVLCTMTSITDRGARCPTSTSQGPRPPWSQRLGTAVRSNPAASSAWAWHPSALWLAAAGAAQRRSHVRDAACAPAIPVNCAHYHLSRMAVRFHRSRIPAGKFRRKCPRLPSKRNPASITRS